MMSKSVPPFNKETFPNQRSLSKCSLLFHVPYILKKKLHITWLLLWLQNHTVTSLRFTVKCTRLHTITFCELSPVLNWNQTSTWNKIALDNFLDSKLEILNLCSASVERNKILQWIDDTRDKIMNEFACDLPIPSIVGLRHWSTNPTKQAGGDVYIGMLSVLWQGPSVSYK